MLLQAEEPPPPPWKLKVQAKANNFDVGIKATKAWPAARNFFQFSLRLKLSPVDISVKLKPETAIWWKLKFFSSKFLPKKEKKKKKIPEKFRMRFANNRAIAARRSFNITPPRWNALPIKGWNRGTSAALLENLALLWKWIYEKHQNGILLLLLHNVSGRPINTFLHLATLFKNLGPRKLSILLLLLIVAMFSSSILQSLFVRL